MVTTPSMSKIITPCLHSELVHRERLMDQLQSGLHYRLTTICAPAGFGKTTALSQWAHRNLHATAWLSLEEQDNDPVRIWRYVIQALASAVDSQLADRMLPMIQSNPQVSIYVMLDALINELHSLDQEVILIMDDLHLIDNELIHDSLTYFIDYLPNRMHLYLASRQELPFSTVKWEARLEHHSIRLQQLQFTEEEAESFYHMLHRLPISSRQINRLVQRTEGWITGLQIAAISLQRHADHEAFINPKAAIDYSPSNDLFQEVIRGLPPELFQFVLRTSILQRLDSSICDVVMQRSDSHVMLGAIRKLNLFLIPLDNQHEVYRYHHLFSKFLRDQLKSDTTVDVSGLHRAASHSYAARGMLNDAIEHAILAQDHVLLISLLEQCVLSVLERGELSTLIRWLESVPDPSNSLSPLLSVLYVFVLVSTGQIKRAQSELIKIERRLSSIEISEERQELEGGIFMIKANLLFATGEFKQWFEYAEQLHGHELPEGQIFYNFNFNGTEPYIRRTPFGLKGAMTDQTISATRKLVDILQTHGWSNSLLCLYAAQGLAEGYYEMNLLEESEAILQQIEKTARAKQIPGLLVPNRIVQAQIYYAAKQPLLALDTIDDILHTVQKWSAYNWLSPLRALRAHILLSENDIDQAKREIASLRIQPDDVPSINKELEYITLARLLYMQSHYEQALRLLDLLKPAALREGQLSSIVHLNKLHALIQYSQGNKNSAYASLKEALAIGERNQFIRSFIDEGPAMVHFMQAYVSDHSQHVKPCDREQAYLPYISKLMDAFPKQESNVSTCPVNILEALTPQELRMLQLLIEGHTNQSIAEKMNFTIGTVKVYLSRIYSKLHVTSRLQATVKAQALLTSHPYKHPNKK